MPDTTVTPSFDILGAPLREGQLLIEASAGTGKTFALTGLVLRLVLEGVPLPQILVVTFTVAATDELKTRIRSNLRQALATFESDEPGAEDAFADFRSRFGSDEASRRSSIELMRQALRDVDQAAVHTIHGFCQRVLQQAAFESGTPFDADITADATELFERAAADFWLHNAYDDGFIAALTVETRERDLREHYRKAYRYPETRIEPRPPSLGEAVERLFDAARAVSAEWTAGRDEARALISEVSWNKGAPLGDADALSRTFTTLDDQLEASPHACIDLIRHLSVDCLQQYARKRSKAEKAMKEQLGTISLFVSCQDFVDAFEAARTALTYAYVREVRERFDMLKREANVLTFDDLLHRLDDALRPEAPGRERLLESIRRRWSHALIDEFQDTDPVQYRIFRTAFAGRPLVFVGDPKQAIYSFRGADIHAYLRARKDTEEAETADGGTSRFMLDTNWRSAGRLVDAINVLFERPSTPFIDPGIPFERTRAAGRADAKPLRGDDRPPLVWWLAPDSDDVSKNKDGATDVVVRGVVAGIAELLASDCSIDGRPLRAGDIAVLVRANADARKLEQTLVDVGVPAVITSDANVWTSSEAADVEYVLRAFLRPSDRAAVCNALSTEIWGFDAAGIHALRRDEDAFEAVRRGLEDAGMLWRRHGVLRAFSRFVDENEVIPRLLGYVDGERRVTNLRHILELLHEAERRDGRGPEETIRWLRNRDSAATVDQETAELRLETDASAVQIATIHKSKGLQYPIVIAPFLWQAKEPFKEDSCVLVHEGGEAVYELGSSGEAKERSRLATAERLAEDLRLAYVALTRAVHRCYVVWGPLRGAQHSALGYLLHGHEAPLDAPPDHVEASFDVTTKALSSASASVRGLASEHSDLMIAEDLPSSIPARHAVGATHVVLNPRVLTDDARTRLMPWTVTSFSALSRTEDVEHAAPIVRETRPVGIAAFAAGREAGSCLHEIIEEADFAALGRADGDERALAEIDRLITRKLESFGLDRPDMHRGGPRFDPVEAVRSMLVRLARTPLPGAHCRLCDLDARRILHEWRFLLPVAEITPGALADVIARHGPDDFARSYAARVRELRPEALDGFLTGIADLAFERDGRWFVLDWKSTLLSATEDQYAASQLAVAARDHHYVLQLIIYTLGLHRYLKTRLTDYDYDRHVGGAGVVFLRGVDGQTDRGFYTLRPSRELVVAAEEMLKPVPA